VFQQSNHVLNFVIYFLLTCGLSISLGFFFRILFLRGLFILATKKGKKISELILPSDLILLAYMGILKGNKSDPIIFRVLNSDLLLLLLFSS